MSARVDAVASRVQGALNIRKVSSYYMIIIIHLLRFWLIRVFK